MSLSQYPSLPMNLRDLLSPEAVLLSLDPGSKEAIIERLVAALPRPQC